MNIYFPSCNFTARHPDSAKQARAYFKERMKVAGCCKFDRNEYTDEDQGYVLCQACREILSPKINIKSIWEYIDDDEDFVFPDYHGQKMIIQDCWRDRDQKDVHIAVRNLLKKLNIEAVEIEASKEKANFCGNIHLEVENEELLERMKQYPDTPISKLPEGLQADLFKDYVSHYPGSYPIICTCNSCLLGVQTGGGDGIHLLELIFPATN